MRFALMMLAVAVVAIVGLFVYGHLMEPETRLIEQEAARAGDL